MGPKVRRLEKFNGLKLMLAITKASSEHPARGPIHTNHPKMG